MAFNWRETPHGPVLDFSLDRVIREHVSDVLAYTEGHQRWAASELGVNPSTLCRWLVEWYGKDEAR